VAAADPDAAMTRTYRDPQLLWLQAAVATVMLALGVGEVIIFWPRPVALLVLVLIPVGVVLGARASRQGVRTDAEGLTVRDQWNDEERLRWDEIERFEVVRTDRHVAVAQLRDGTKVTLEPLGGAPAQTAAHRQRWAEQSVEGLNDQLRRYREASAARPAATR
jgi:hypothetical protein